jgi:hypothetical protein
MDNKSKIVNFTDIRKTVNQVIKNNKFLTIPKPAVNDIINFIEYLHHKNKNIYVTYIIELILQKMQKISNDVQYNVDYRNTLEINIQQYLQTYKPVHNIIIVPKKIKIRNNNYQLIKLPSLNQNRIQNKKENLNNIIQRSIQPPAIPKSKLFNNKGEIIVNKLDRVIPKKNVVRSAKETNIAKKVEPPKIIHIPLNDYGIYLFVQNLDYLKHVANFLIDNGIPIFRYNHGNSVKEEDIEECCLQKTNKRWKPVPSIFIYRTSISKEAYAKAKELEVVLVDRPDINQFLDYWNYYCTVTPPESVIKQLKQLKHN